MIRRGRGRTGEAVPPEEEDEPCGREVDVYMPLNRRKQKCRSISAVDPGCEDGGTCLKFSNVAKKNAHITGLSYTQLAF